MSIVAYYFKRAFRLKIIYVKDQNENKWIIQGLQFQVKERDFLTV